MVGPVPDGLPRPSDPTGRAAPVPPPGWYNADGDPTGAIRYWDGERWVGDAVKPQAVVGLAPLLTTATSVVFAAVALFCAAAAVLMFREASRFRAWQDAGFADEAEDALAEAEGATTIAVDLAILIGFVALILTIVWLRRASFAVDRFGGLATRSWSHDWAVVGGWFIPFANAVIPKLVLHEVERLSSPESGEPPVMDRWRRNKLHIDGWIWWLTMLAGTLLVIFALGLTGDQYDPDTHVNGLYIYATGLVLLAVSAVAGSLTIRRLGAQINRPLAEDTTGEPALPPTPPRPYPPAPTPGYAPPPGTPATSAQVTGSPGPPPPDWWAAPQSYRPPRNRRSHWWWLVAAFAVVPAGFLAFAFHEACCTHDLLDANFETDSGPFVTGENDWSVAEVHAGTYRLTAKTGDQYPVWTAGRFARPTTTAVIELTVIEPGSGDVGVACFEEGSTGAEGGFAFFIGGGEASIVVLRAWGISDPQLSGPELRAARRDAALETMPFDDLRPGQRIAISCALGDVEAYVDGERVLASGYGGPVSGAFTRFDRGAFFFHPAHAGDVASFDDVDAHLPE